MTRNQSIVYYSMKGKKQTDMGRMFGISRQRVGQILRKDKKWLLNYYESSKD